MEGRGKKRKKKERNKKRINEIDLLAIPRINNCTVLIF